MEDIRPGRWRHYKGNDYEVLYTARHSETLEPMVVYSALYGEGGVWVRPAAMWRETINGSAVRRFKYTGDPDIVLRQELSSDFREDENLTREAFWNTMKPGCDEHYLLHVMRDDPSFIPELDFVAEQDGKIIGHIAYTRSYVDTADGRRLQAITFGPVSVLPSCQKSGVGARLIFHTMDLARDMGFKAVIILGHPEYYPELGFKRAREFGLTLEGGASFDALMALELIPGSLSGLSGVYHYADIYNISPADAEAFDRTFPPKKKKVTDPLS